MGMKEEEEEEEVEDDDDEKREREREGERETYHGGSADQGDGGRASSAGERAKHGGRGWG